MGINKPNVRYVINYDLPKSLEEYYQQIGRAGRDGLASYALLLYSGQDVHKIRFFFDEVADSEKSERLLQGMLNYATAKTCRRKVLLNYFGENYDSEKNEIDAISKEDCCDICATGPIPALDVTIPSQKMMSCIIRLNMKYGSAYVIDVLLGSRSQRILENSHNLLSTWGIGKDFSKNDWFILLDGLIDAGFIQKYGEYNILQVTNKGLNALKNRETIKLPVLIHQHILLNTSPAKEKTSMPIFALHKKGAFVKNLNSDDLALYEKIKQWRKKQAEELNVPPYVIFGDKTLEELVEKKPRTENELLQIFGIGQVKAEKIGSQLIRMIEE